jgi:PEP-CTERM motif
VKRKAGLNARPFCYVCKPDDYFPPFCTVLVLPASILNEFGTFALGKADPDVYTSYAVHSQENSEAPKMKKIFLLLLIIATATMYGFPSCGTAQINVASLVDCTSGDVNFTGWSFAALLYTGTATIQIQVPAAGQYGIDPEIVTLRFSNPTLANSNFSLGFTATLTSAFQFNSIAQDILAGNVPNNATATGVYNGGSLTTDGSSFASLFNQGTMPMTSSVAVSLTGSGANPAPPPPCGPPGLCGGGPIQKIDMNLYQALPAAVPEPVTVGLVGLGLVAFAIVRRRR